MNTDNLLELKPGVKVKSNQGTYTFVEIIVKNNLLSQKFNTYVELEAYKESNTNPLLFTDTTQFTVKLLDYKKNFKIIKEESLLQWYEIIKNNNVEVNSMENNWKLNIGVIGCGNAGSQVANMSAIKNFDTVAINSSSRDLALIDKVSNKIIIGNGRGAGKSRFNTQDYIKDPKFMEELKDHKLDEFIRSKDLIFVISSTAGGTGSMLSTVIAKFINKINPRVTVILVGILPSVKDSYGAIDNTVDYLKRIQDFTYMLYDNKERSTISELNGVNSKIVKDLEVISGRVLEHHGSYNSIDEQDLLAVLNCKGRLIVNRLENMSSTMDNIEQAFIEALNNNTFIAELGTNKKVSNVAIIQNVTNAIFDRFNPNMPNFISYLGNVRNTYLHQNTSNDNSIYSISSGHDFPNTVGQLFVDRYDELKRQIEEEVNTLDLFANIKTETRVQSTEDKEHNIDEIDFSSLF